MSIKIRIKNYSDLKINDNLLTVKDDTTCKSLLKNLGISQTEYFIIVKNKACSPGYILNDGDIVEIHQIIIGG